ncbi:hypothetical protein [Winogradskyella haliclonae]|uniref:Uncharacterized protein n=1 Tax=Winogradskyella haliclonae TaxID=2048558 RepID=A0ABQ2C0U1_9FLAO|nr:hypothetical protein [Winogradskyella haliclonae]GGI57969.1 hypothetical protein GCM10011444_22780 [Winogradskyella haliclonae]
MSEETEQPKKKINWTTDKIMSTSALFISVISLIALLYQSYLAREENRLIQMQQSANVIPYLQFENIYNVRSFSIHMVNKGVGPAFVKKVSFAVNDSLKFDNSTNALLHITKNRIRKGDSIGYNGSITIKENTVVQPGENISVFEISSTNNSDFSGVKSFKDYINNSPPTFTIVYEDIYGNQWKLSNNENKQDFQFLTPTLIKKID